jgi:hypothetical protein
METRGFNREYRTGKVVRTDLQAGLAGEIESGSPDTVSYRDVTPRSCPANNHARSPSGSRPWSGRERSGNRHGRARAAPVGGLCDRCGGDLYVAGCNPDGAPWSIGIRHPRHGDQLIDSVRASNLAVCRRSRRLLHRGSRDFYHEDTKSNSFLRAFAMKSLSYPPTWKSFVAAGVPFRKTSTLYCPGGHPSGFETWNSVRALPLGAMVWVDSFTTCPSW